MSNHIRKDIIYVPELLLLILFTIISVYSFYTATELPVLGVVIILVLILIFVLRPKIRIVDAFIRNFTIGSAIIMVALFLLLRSLRDTNDIRLFPFSLHFIGGFCILSAFIRSFRITELKSKRSVLGFLAFILFLGATFKNPVINYAYPLTGALIILGIILILEIIFIYKKQDIENIIPGYYYFTVFLILIFTSIISVAMIFIIPEAMRFVEKSLIPSGISFAGFSSVSRIGDIHNIKLSKQVIMHVKGDVPYYLRGNIYERVTYSENTYSWQSRNKFTDVTADENKIMKLTEQDPPAEVNFHKTEVFLKSSRFSKENNIFLPVNPFRMSSELERIKFEPELKTALSPLNFSILEYSVDYLPVIKEEISEPEKYLVINEEIREKFQALADTIEKDAVSDFDKVSNLSRFFTENDFKYSLEVDISKKHDPILHFLNSSRKGYCEYYASASVILLRLMNVKTRYVSGFVISEESKDQEYFVVRALHAHAWVEYYDDQESNWETFDPTSYAKGFDLNEGYNPGKFELFIESMLFKLERFRQGLRKITIEDIQYQLQKLINNWVFNLVLLFIVILYVILRLVFSKDKIGFDLLRKRKKGKITLSPEYRKWMNLIKILLKLLERNGIKKDRELTLMEFLNNLKQNHSGHSVLPITEKIIRDFYLFLYRGDSFPISHIESLGLELSEIRNNPHD